MSVFTSIKNIKAIKLLTSSWSVATLTILSIGIIGWGFSIDASNIPASKTIQPMPIGEIEVEKELISHPAGNVDIGDTTTFRITYTNNGVDAITSFDLIDSFPTANLQYVSATPVISLTAPDLSTAGVIAWNNLTNLEPGESITVDVTFVTTNTCSSCETSATIPDALDVFGASSSDASVISFNIINNISISKSLISHPNGIAEVGDNLVFEITYTNNGATDISSFDLIDSFPAANMNYVSATDIIFSATVTF